jgi:hypothetical protein
MIEPANAPALGTTSLPSDPPPATDAALGREVCAATMGLDRLERRLHGGHGPLDSEGLVPIWIGDAFVEVPTFAGWEDVDAALSGLDARMADVPPGPRRLALVSILASVRAALALFQGATLTYAEKLERLVHVPAEPVAADVFAALQADLDAALADGGTRTGTLAERVRRWEAERTIDAGSLTTTFAELMGEARTRTDALIAPVGDYDMALNPVRGVPYTARCNFAEGRMDLNIDLAFSRAALKHLVAHEVFPGHSTQLLLTRDAVAAGTARADVLLCTLNGSTGAVQEGIGDQGTHLIDWIEDADDRVHGALRRLRSAGQASAAWFLMADGWDEGRVRAWLRDEACGQPAWVDGRVRFARHPFRGPFIASYWFGDEAVRTVRERATGDRRPAFLAYLYGRSNSVQSLLSFEPVTGSAA